jgi:membrane protease YdiL (CAAX protease family)
MKPETLTVAQSTQLMILGFMMFTVIACSIGSWVIFLNRVANRKSFQTSRGPLATVGFIDLAMGILLFLGLTFVAAQSWVMVKGAFATQKGATSVNTDELVSNPPSQEVPSSVQKSQEGDNVRNPSPQKNSPWKSLSSDDFLFSGWLSIAQLVAATAVACLIVFRTGTSLRSIGVNPGMGLRDLIIGLWVLFLTIPCLLLVSATVSYLSGISYSHPVIDAIRNYPWLIWVVAWQAVIVAPITEEFLFRTVLIGWFESAHFGRNPTSVLQGWLPTGANRYGQVSRVETAIVGSQVRQHSNNPYEATSVSSTLANSENSDDSASDPFTPPWWPSIVSGLLFGLAHASYGVSWVPLVIFGVILGRVYQLRQSLLMCIFIHMIFNAINLLNLWLSVDLPIK